ncbi:MAG: porin family protein [Sphingobium sp.]
MRYLIPLALAGGLLAGTSAMAQEQAPFTGPRVELLTGYDSLSAGGEDLDNSRDGVAYGVGVGYDIQFGEAIVGIEGEWTDSTTKLRSYDIDVPGDFARLNTDRDLYIGGRVGIAATPSTLVYLKGGYTNARLETEYRTSGSLYSEGRTLDGWRVGAGVEQKFNLFGPSGYVKAEYRYSNYSNLDIGDFDADVDVDRHQVLAGVGIRF